LLPFVPNLEAYAQPAGGIPKRYAYWYFGVMPIQSLLLSMYPTPGTFAFRSGFSALNPIAANLTLVRGLSNPAFKASAQDVGIGSHPCGGITYWTGKAFRKQLTPVIYTNSVRDNSGAILTGGVGNTTDSVDQALSKVLIGKAPYPDLRVGVGNKADKDGDVSISISVKNGAVVPRHQSPLCLYNQVFKFLTPPSGGGGGAASSLLAQRKSALDFTLTSMTTLKNEVSSSDKQRLEQHETSIREVEQGIINQMNGAMGSPMCQLPANLMQVASAAANEQTTPDVYSKMTALAFVCRLTHVAGGFFGVHASTTQYSWVPSANGKGVHDTSHNGDPQSDAYMVDVMKHRVTTFRKLVEEIKLQKEVDNSSLLDHTLVVMGGDTSGSHIHDDTFTLMASSSPKLRSNQMTTVANGKTNQVLHTVANFMGYPNLAVGDAAIGTQILPTAVYVP
jgi:hypothetical protein